MKFWTGIVLYGTLLLPTVAYCQTQLEMVAQWHREAAQYPIEKQKAKEAGIPLSVKEMKMPLPPENENAAPLYKKMEEVRVPDDAEKILYEFSYENTPTPAQVEKAQKALEQCSPLLILVHEVAARPKCVFDRVWDITNPGFEVFTDYAYARTATALLISESLLLAHQGKGTEAVHSLALGFQIAQHMCTDGTITGWLVGKNIEVRILSGMWRILYVQKDAQTAHAIEQTIGQEWKPMSLAPALAEQAAFQQDMLQIGRKAGFFPFFKEMATPEEDTSTSKANQEARGTFTAETRAAIKANEAVVFDANATFLLRWMRKLNEAADLSYPKALPIFTAYQRDQAISPSMPEDQRAMRILSSLHLDLSRLIFDRAQGAARASTIRAGAAVLAYQAEHGGNLPETLDLAISPTPTDPFSDQPLHYRKEGIGQDAGFVVYSTGPEGTFDGGKPGAKISSRNAGCGFRYPFPVAPVSSPPQASVSVQSQAPKSPKPQSSLSERSNQHPEKDSRNLLTLKHDRDVEALTVAFDGKTLATATGDALDLAKPLADYLNQSGNDLVLWNITDGKKLHTFTAKGIIDALTFSPDGTLLASGGKFIEIWQVKTGTLVHEFPSTEAVKSLAFSPDGKTLSVVNADGMLTQWTLKTGIKAREWRVSKDYAFAVAYTPKGDVLVTGGDYDGQLKLWDAGKGTLLGSVRAHSNAIDGVAVSHDGTRVVAGSWDGTASVWDIRTRKLLFVLKGHSSNIWSVAFSPDSRRIASVSSEIKVWDAATGKLLRTIPGGNMHVSFVGNSRTIASDKGKVVWIRSLDSPSRMDSTQH